MKTKPLFSTCTKEGVLSIGTGYVLITAAYNEQDNIGNLILAVERQTVLPKRWVIVSDGSTDGTDQIVQEHSRRIHFIEFVRLEKEEGVRGFASKVRALGVATKSLSSVTYGFIGNLDADVTFEDDYFERLILVFAHKPKLGITGGYVYDWDGAGWIVRGNNDGSYVSGAAQFFRRECFESIGHYEPLPFGGEDTVMTTRAKMLGWEVISWPKIKVYHHEHGNSKRGLVRESFRMGRAASSIGAHPLLEFFRWVILIPSSPLGIRAASRMLGYFYEQVVGKRRLVSKEFVKFLRKDEFKRMKVTLGRLVSHR